MTMTPAEQRAVERLREATSESGSLTWSGLVETRKTALAVLSLIDRLTTPPAAGHYTVEHDGFSGTEIGRYQRLDGERGVVLQQDGTKVVHVYREKWLVPSPFPAEDTPPASARETVREARRIFNAMDDALLSSNSFSNEDMISVIEEGLNRVLAPLYAEIERLKEENLKLSNDITALETGL